MGQAEMLLRYKEWLKYVFDRPVSPHGWYFDLDVEPFDAPVGELIELVTCTLENSGRDLSVFSNDQVYCGLEYIFNNSCSDTVFALKSDDIPVRMRLAAISSLKTLYRDCFAPRCAPVLCHSSDAGANPLNRVCYMLWDVSPLSYWEESDLKDVFYHAIVDVMADASMSSNPACVESGLHGLGHTQMY